MIRRLLFLFLLPILIAQAAKEVEIIAEPNHHLVLSNDQVRVFNVALPPHADTLMWNAGHPDEDRGLDILHGGTRETLFVKDGVRVSEFELQPGGMVPMRHHTGPYLLVAVTDLDIREDGTLGKLEGQANVIGHFQSGAAKWIRGGYSHTINNAAHHPIKFVTLEFR